MSNLDYVYLVDLDSVLDTRLGVLAYNNLDAFKDVINNPGYFTRLQDDMSLLTDKVTRDQWYEWWDNRTSECLKFSRTTNIIRTLADQISDLIYQRDITNDARIGEIKISLNLYPYNDLSDEAKENFRLVLHHFYPLISLKNITTCFLPPGVLSPEYLKDNYSMVVMYDLAKWANSVFNGEEYTGKSASSVDIMTPTIFERNSYPDQELWELFENDSDRIFGMAEFQLSDVVSINFQDTARFCILNNKPIQIKNAQKSGTPLTPKEHNESTDPE